MNNKKALMMGAEAVTLSMPAAQKAEAASANLNINAVVLQAIALAEAQPLVFGTLAADAALAGTVTLTPDGTAGGTLGTSNVSHLGANVVGLLDLTAGTGIVVNIAANTATVNIPCTATCTPANTMAVDAFQFRGDGNTGAPITVNLTGAGTTQIEVGATLNVNAGQAAGSYAGVVQINANY